MARVIAEEVKLIAPNTLSDLEPHIAGANSIVTDELASTGLSTVRLKEIERWLAAHFAACSENDLRVVEREAGESRDRYGEASRGVLGPGLALTRFGQQVILLDTTGTLAAIGKTRARLTVVKASNLTAAERDPNT